MKFVTIVKDVSTREINVIKEYFQTLIPSAQHLVGDLFVPAPQCPNGKALIAHAYKLGY